MSSTTPIVAATSVEARVLDAAKACVERWGMAKLTIDDIAAEAGVSRATLYRMFPGGKDVLFEALRVRELEDFFTRLAAHLDHADDLEDLLVRTVVSATEELRHDQHLAVMLASEPGETLGECPPRRDPRSWRHQLLPRALRPRRLRRSRQRSRVHRHVRAAGLRAAPDPSLTPLIPATQELPRS